MAFTFRTTTPAEAATLDTPDCWGNVALTDALQHAQEDIVRLSRDLRAANGRIDTLLAEHAILRDAVSAQRTNTHTAEGTRIITYLDVVQARADPTRVTCAELITFLALDYGCSVRSVRERLTTTRYAAWRACCPSTFTPGTWRDGLLWLAEPDGDEPGPSRFTHIERGDLQVGA